MRAFPFVVVPSGNITVWGQPGISALLRNFFLQRTFSNFFSAAGLSHIGKRAEKKKKTRLTTCWSSLLISLISLYRRKRERKRRPVDLLCCLFLAGVCPAVNPHCLQIRIKWTVDLHPNCIATFILWCKKFDRWVAAILNLEQIAHWSKEGMLRKFSFCDCSCSSSSNHYRVDDRGVGGDHQKWCLPRKLSRFKKVLSTSHLGRTFLGPAGFHPDPDWEGGESDEQVQQGLVAKGKGQLFRLEWSVWTLKICINNNVGLLPERASASQPEAGPGWHCPRAPASPEGNCKSKFYVEHAVTFDVSKKPGEKKASQSYQSEDEQDGSKGECSQPPPARKPLVPVAPWVDALLHLHLLLSLHFQLHHLLLSAHLHLRLFSFFCQDFVLFQ